jgi:excisionase family DNA binding protein
MKEYKLSPGDLAKVLKKSPRFIAREILSGRLVGIKIGRTFRVAQEDFEEYVARLIVPPPPQYSDAFQSAIDQQQLEADDRYCTDNNT